MLKKVFLIIVIIICLFVLTGCKHINYGVVMEKSFSKAHITYNPIITCVNNKTRIVHRWMPHPDRWSILVQNDDGSEWWNVTNEFYDSVAIGDKIDRRKKATDQ